MPTLLQFKIADLLAIAGVLVFVGYYTFLAPWWREAFGLTLVVKDVLLAALLVLVGLSLFFTLNRETSKILAWVQLGLLYGIGPAMFWRAFVFGQIEMRNGGEWLPMRQGWRRRRASWAVWRARRRQEYQVPQGRPEEEAKRPE